MSCGDVLMLIAYILPKNTPNPTEYFCLSCGQLRLDYSRNKAYCKNCGSKDIITGQIGSLDKEALKKQSGKF